MIFLILLSCVVEPVKDYEWFHSAFNKIESRVEQVRSTSEAIKTETNATELSMLKTELRGQEQSCRDLISDYNANSDKVHRSLFMGGTLPDHINLEACDH